MTPEEITAMAREAGFENALGGIDGLDELRHFAALVAAKEREACAQVCDGMHEEDRPSDYAYSIRARGQKEGV